MFRFSSTRAVLTVATVAALGSVAPVRADITFSPTPNFVQPSENLLFSRPGLNLGPAITIQGATNNTQTIVNLTGDENIVGNGGQARVEGSPGNFSNLLIDFADPTLTFTQFEANVNLELSGTILIQVIEGNGEVNNFSFTGTGGGQNFFGLNAINGQQINTVSINATGILDNIQDVRQIRLGGINRVGTAVSPVPEPGTWVAMGTMLGMTGLGLLRARRRRNSA